MSRFGGKNKGPFFKKCKASGKKGNMRTALCFPVKKHGKEESTLSMNKYVETIELYFELKGTPESSQESYLRRIRAFLKHIQNKENPIEDMNDDDIQQYILYLKKTKGLSAGTINNYISSIKFFYTYVLEKEWNSKKIPRMKRISKLSCYSA